MIPTHSDLARLVFVALRRLEALTRVAPQIGRHPASGIWNFIGPAWVVDVIPWEFTLYGQSTSVYVELSAYRHRSPTEMLLRYEARLGECEKLQAWNTDEQIEIKLRQFLFHAEIPYEGEF